MSQFSRCTQPLLCLPYSHTKTQLGPPTLLSHRRQPLLTRCCIQGPRWLSPPLPPLQQAAILYLLGARAKVTCWAEKPHTPSNNTTPADVQETPVQESRPGTPDATLTEEPCTPTPMGHYRHTSTTTA